MVTSVLLAIKKFLWLTYLGEQYVKAMQDMSKSNNAKTVVLPADILSTIRGVMGREEHLTDAWFH